MPRETNLLDFSPGMRVPTPSSPGLADLKFRSGLAHMSMETRVFRHTTGILARLQIQERELQWVNALSWDAGLLQSLLNQCHLARQQSLQILHLQGRLQLRWIRKEMKSLLIGLLVQVQQIAILDQSSPEKCLTNGVRPYSPAQDQSDQHVIQTHTM